LAITGCQPFVFGDEAPGPLSPIGQVHGDHLTLSRNLKAPGLFTCHDLRHSYITRKRQEGHDYFRIMAATGHKTLSVFKRYNTVSQKELRKLADMDTNRDTWGTDCFGGVGLTA